MKTRRLVILFAVVVDCVFCQRLWLQHADDKARKRERRNGPTWKRNYNAAADLINNLVEAAKMAGIQEQEVFGTIAKARSRLLNATSQAPQGEGGDKTPEQKQAVIDAANQFRRHARTPAGVAGSVSAVADRMKTS